MIQEEREPASPEITCKEVVQWASAYLDDRVGDERKRQIVLHLALCAGCETYMDQIATVREMVRVLPRPEDASLNIGRLQQAFVDRSNRLRSNR